MSVERVACIAFDSPAHSLIERGLASGRLPVLGGLLRSGRMVALRDHQEILTPPSWPTLIRGCDLPDHRLHADRQLITGEYRIGHVRPDAAARPPFWRYLSDAGIRSIVLGAYSAPVLEDFNGLQVCGWGSHDPFAGKLGLVQSDPPELVEQLDRLVGPRALRYAGTPPRSARQARAYVSDMIRGVGQQSQAFIHLLRSTDWRFSFVSLAECHQAGHWLWHLADPEHPEYDAELAPGLRDGLMQIYEATDRALGAAVAALPAETVILVISPYSMGPNHHLDEVLPILLERGGWLTHPEPGQVSARIRGLRAGRRVVRALVPPRLRPALGRAVGRDRLLTELTEGGIDWDRTATLPIWSDGSAAVRLNMVGREPNGTIAKGPDAERVLRELTDTLLDLRCADSGERLVSRVARFEELFDDVVPYSGPAELFIQWERVQRPRAVCSQRTGEIAVPAERSIRSVHYVPGMVVGAGPGIPPSGEALLRPASEAKLADLGATVLALLGAPAPPEITGQPMPALVPAAAARDA